MSYPTCMTLPRGYLRNGLILQSPKAFIPTLQLTSTWQVKPLSQHIISMFILLQVGPLPVSPSTKILPLSYIYNSGRSFSRLLLPVFDIQPLLPGLQISIIPQVIEVLKEVFHPVSTYSTRLLIDGGC